jgi:[NiFe] hydrogenase assembly HybE family chaperone
MMNRVQALEDFYRLVQRERMQGIPLLNAALCVEAVGFEWTSTEDEEPVAEGVLITPWFMSLVRLPAQPLPHGGQVGRSFVRDFGSERFDFIGAHDPAIGYHETCALFSPMGEFATQALARETAREALALTRPAPPVTPPPVPSRRAFFLGGRA